MSPCRRAAAGLALTGSALAALLGAPGAAASVAGAADEEAPRPLLTFQDPEITESSGLADLGDVLLTVNDSGSAPVVHLVDRTTGGTVGRTTYADEVTDVEAVAVGPDGTVWVGDIGDNGARRMSIAVHRLEPLRPGDRRAQATRFELGYVGGPRDAEALLVHPRTGRLYVVGKGLLGGEVWAAPPRLSSTGLNVLRPVGEVGPLVTDGAFLPDGVHAVLRSYTAATLYETDTWERVAWMQLPRQPQGEGLAVTRDGSELLLSTEGAHTEVLAVPFAPAFREALQAAASPGSDEPGTKGAGPQDSGAEEAAADERGTRWEVVASAVLAVGLLAGVLVPLRAARRRGRSTR